MNMSLILGLPFSIKSWSQLQLKKLIDSYAGLALGGAFILCASSAYVLCGNAL